ncbi:MAG: glycosyltransferase [Candidatus Aenigmatarchaeota archaeon]
MKIAVYHPWIHCKGGAERMILELVTRLKNYEWVIFTHYFNPDLTFPMYRKLKVVNLGKKTKLKGFLLRGLILGINILTTKIHDLKNFDLFIVSTSGIGELITLRNHKIPTFCYCHTPLRATHEFYSYYKSQINNLWKKILFIFGVHLYNFLERIAWKKFKKVLCNSKNVKKRIIRAKLFPKGKIKVIYPGVDINFFKPTWKFKKYFFAPGRIKRYKRFELAIDAFKLFNKRKKGFKLIIAGNLDDMEYLSWLKSLAKSKIKFIMNPTDKQLLNLYQNCLAVIFTAKNEDWGIVPLEAMACGKPVIAVNEGGVKESIIKDKTGYLLKADPKIFADKMLELADSKNILTMGKNAYRRAKLFSWEIFAKNIEEVLKNVYKKYL